jgi:hypothetical protein
VYSTQWIKRVAGTLMVGLLLAVAYAGVAQAGNGSPKQAEERRAQAMNRYYHLGAFSKGATAVQQAEERRAQATNRFYNLGTNGAAAVRQAEERRAEAMNQYYKLGINGAAVQRANERRAQAMNRYFRLGSYAVVGGSTGFVWTDAGIGAGAMLGAIVLAGGLLVAVRRRTTGKPSYPSAT